MVWRVYRLAVTEAAIERRTGTRTTSLARTPLSYLPLSPPSASAFPSSHSILSTRHLSLLSLVLSAPSSRLPLPLLLSPHSLPSARVRPHPRPRSRSLRPPSAPLTSAPLSSRSPSPSVGSLSLSLSLSLSHCLSPVVSLAAPRVSTVLRQCQ